MPRATFENAKGPERIPYHLRTKPATPIEIPRRQRHVPSPLNSPTAYPSSPDLVFEMSPISATYSPLSTMFSVASMPPDHPEEDEPFMYRVPVFRSSGLEDRSWPRPTRSRESPMPSRNSSNGPISHTRRAESPHNDPVIITGDFGDGFDEGMSTHSTTKITGFFPLKPDQPPTADLLPKFVGRLSPPPRRSSFAPAPWASSGSGCTEEDMSYSQVDPSAFEFQRHLIRRIESKDRFASLRCL
ncbi:hypothetical protein CPB83DRAFT_340900 [Crepidotus variabilis]|uniref:Uncharacterized protein n=1 Tax=Crepidotus variabilis TaxID=179855 RepID=A0A9P6ETE0_9AGAR|nr:hypothetical protein CPB83DRAFT_340900 [Crepidotus variabilis]